MVSIKHGTILHGVDLAWPIGHGPIVHENIRVPYRLDTSRFSTGSNHFCITDSCTIEPVLNRFCMTDSCTIEPVLNRWRVQSIRCSIILVHNRFVRDRLCWIDTVQNRTVLDRYHPEILPSNRLYLLLRSTLKPSFFYVKTSLSGSW